MQAAQIQAVDDSGIHRDLAMDERHRSLVVGTQQEKHISEGSHYYVKTWLEVPKASTVQFMFITPSLPLRVHAYAALGASREVIATIHMDAAVSDNGDPVPHWNNNHNAHNPLHGGALDALMQTYANPAVTNLGTEVFAAMVGGDMPGLKMNYEIQPKVDSHYIWQVVNENEDKGAQVDIDFWWWEGKHKERTDKH